MYTELINYKGITINNMGTYILRSSNIHTGFPTTGNERNSLKCYSTQGGNMRLCKGLWIYA